MYKNVDAKRLINLKKCIAQTMLQEISGHILKTGKKPLKKGGRGTLLNGEVITWGL